MAKNSIVQENINIVIERAQKIVKKYNKKNLILSERLMQMRQIESKKE